MEPRHPRHKVCRCDSCQASERDAALREQEARRVIAAVAGYFGIDPAAVTGRDRHAATANARHFAIHACSTLLGFSSVQVGRMFGRNHTTVLYSLNRTRALLAASPVARAQAEQIADLLTPTPKGLMLPMAPLLRLVTADALSRCDPTTRTEFYRARQAVLVPSAVADRLALRLLGLHPVLVWGDAWLYERDRAAHREAS